MSAADGFHVTSYQHMSSTLLASLAVILGLMEALGELPRQIALLVMALIPKKAGGRRPIGIEPSPLRLIGRLRRPLARQAENRLHVACPALTARSRFSAADSV